ncbi:MAG: hypothetical protein QF645_06755 [Planctomycetota bacterium]|nr:hypothetical protein [Planctomycetota bacterium]
MPGPYSEKLELTVTDGRQSVTQVVPLQVQRTGDEEIRGFGILGKLRAKKAETRKATI